MRTKFTKASQKDKTLVTVNLAQFHELVMGWDSYSIGDTVVLRIDGEETIFRVNRIRNDKAVTAVTHCFPRFLRLPQIGRPVYAQVTEVS